ncbi:AraC family transcriptional regulator [Paenibacillus sp. WQ 127069]|uniref:AraC family transcriptional regulator n=1 Tax=Paenibacillus baimaensis TaxID=2982185 RepID=A0ABT2UUA1_9BACL|nr:AraC family transcriptional regulator [Paenibacillus sp. WQ 127069]MCU6798224.1 AraC family transcriptional regulator [Paenibacillus sp. WQ 127069]
MYYSLSRLSALDVKWADLFDANQESFQEFHHNPYYELILVADGTVYLQAGEEKLTLHAGDSLLLMPWEQHRGWQPNERQGHFFWVQFASTPDITELDYNRAPQLKIVHAPPGQTSTSQQHFEEALVLPRRFQTRNRYKLLSCFEELVQLLIKPKGYFRFQATLLLGEILFILTSEFLEQSHTDSAFPSSYTTFRKLLSHINNNYETDITKEALEQMTDRKYEYLCQIFKRYTGTTMVHYMHQLKIQQAKHLLLHTAQSVQEIGQSVGYVDPFYFSRIFKRVEGISPQHFRQK